VLEIRCPHCGKVLNAPDGTSSGRGRCPHCKAMVDLSTAERVGLRPGTVLGGCRVDELVGRGGMAAVYRATQISLERPVALKVLARKLARRAQFVERFDREATALAQLSHANIVNILDKGVESGHYYFVMEFVEGESLRQRLRRDGKLPFQEALEIFDQVASGLEYAHSHNVLHRDIKPENILITRTGEAKLADFGIARITGDEQRARQRLTQEYARLGTAHYMAPEQVLDTGSVDHHADIYALGVTLYEMLTGELPMGRFRPASQLGDGVPRAVDRVISRALASAPADRFHSVAEFRAALHVAAQRGAAPHGHHGAAPPARRSGAPRTGLIAAAIVAVAAGALLLATAPWRNSPHPSAVAPGKHSQPKAPPAASAAQQREEKASDLLALASRRAAQGKWDEAKALLVQLQRDYADTKLYQQNRDEIAPMLENVEAMLRPKAPDQPPTPKTQPEHKGTPFPVVAPKIAPPKLRPVPPKAEEEPEDAPQATAQMPPAGAREWALFDGTKLDGWRVLDPRPPSRLRGPSVRLGGGRLVLDGGKRAAGIAWTGPLLRENYELAVEAMRIERDGAFLAIVFPVGDASCALVVGGPPGTGLDTIDGQPLPRNPTRRDTWFDSGRLYKISIRVTRTRVAVRVDQNTLLEMPRAGHDFTTPEWCSDFKPLGLLNWRTAAAVRSVRMRRLVFAPRPIISTGPSEREKLLAAVRPLWAKRDYDKALETARAALADAGDPHTRQAARAIVRAAEMMPRLWQIVAAGADAMKGKPFTSRGITGRLVGVRGDALVLGIGAAETSRKLPTLTADEIRTLARAGAEPDNGADHLVLALFAAFDKQPDLALAEKQLAAAKAAGAPAADAADIASLIRLAALPAFRKAVAAARQKLEAGDTKGARLAILKARKRKPQCPEADRIVASALQALLAKAVAACKAADYPKAARFASFAEAIEPQHPDVQRLALWLKENGGPVFVDTFDTPKFDKWEIVDGRWRVAGGAAVCKAFRNEVGKMYIAAPRTTFRNFLLTFDVGNLAGKRAYRFGAVFREGGDDQGRRFLYCLLSSTHSLLCVGGATSYAHTLTGPAGSVEGMRFRYRRREPVYLGGQRFPVEVGRPYHVAIRCTGRAFECYINDVLVAEGATGAATSGRIGLVVHGGECAFDNVRVYIPAPPPELAVLGGEVEVTEPEDQPPEPPEQ